MRLPESDIQEDAVGLEDAVDLPSNKSQKRSKNLGRQTLTMNDQKEKCRVAKTGRERKKERGERKNNKNDTPYLSHIPARITQNLVRRRPRTTMDHGVEGAFVESHVDRARRDRLFQRADVRPAPFDPLLFGVPRAHQLESRVGEVQAQLVGVAAGGEVGGDGLLHWLVVSASVGGRRYAVGGRHSYAVSGAQVDNSRLGVLGRFGREQVLFEEGLEGFVASEPFVGGILSVGLRVATVPVFWRGQGFAFFVWSHDRASVFLFQGCVCWWVVKLAFMRNQRKWHMRGVGKSRVRLRACSSHFEDRY
jgi:hypothetical protein